MMVYCCLKHIETGFLKYCIQRGILVFVDIQIEDHIFIQHEVFMHMLSRKKNYEEEVCHKEEVISHISWMNDLQ